MKKELVKLLESNGIRIKRVEKVRDYFKKNPEEEKFYQEVYYFAIEELKKYKKISPIIKLAKTSIKIFNREFAAACIAARMPLMTPGKYINELYGKRKKEKIKLSPCIERYKYKRDGYNRGKYIPEEH